MRVLSLTAGLFLVAVGSAAPGLPEKPSPYEYAEMRYSRHYHTVQAMPGGPKQEITRIEIEWATSDGALQGDSWEDLAKKMKAPEPKGQASDMVHKMRVLNRLTADGWEVVERPLLPAASGGTVWQFRRKRP